MSIGMPVASIAATATPDAPRLSACTRPCGRAGSWQHALEELGQAVHVPLAVGEDLDPLVVT